MKVLFEHANLTVASAEKTMNFLQTAFPDWKLRGEGELVGPNKGHWVHFGNEEFYVALQQNVDPLTRNDTPYINNGINHLGFVVEDMGGLIERMGVSGYTPAPTSALESHPFRKRAYFYDANGLEWEFVQYLSDKIEERNDYSR